jgi:tetratricopeptide (TPR) repeat protein
MISICLTVLGGFLLTAATTEPPERDYDWGQRKLSEVYWLINETGEYEAAVKVAQEVLKKKNLPEFMTDVAGDVINLISNYSDFKRKPLELFFKAQKTSAPDQLYSELLEKYPKSKLACITIYRVSGMMGWYEKNQELLKQFDIQCAKSTFPINNPMILEKRGIKIAPIMHYRIATLRSQRCNEGICNHGVCRADDEECGKAIQEYRNVLRNYPNERDPFGGSLTADVYVQLLWIYSGKPYGQLAKKNKFINIEKGKKVCDVLLNEYNDQRFFQFGYDGHSQVEARLYLASIEKDKEQKIKLLKETLLAFPESWYGALFCGSNAAYGWMITEFLVQACGSDQRALRELQEIVAVCKGRAGCGIAQLKLADTYAKLGKLKEAIRQYRIAAKKFKNVELDGEGISVDSEAERAIEEIGKKSKSQ